MSTESKKETIPELSIDAFIRSIQVNSNTNHTLFLDMNPFVVPVILRLDIFQMVSRLRKKLQELVVCNLKNCAAVSCCNGFSSVQA